MNMINDCGPAFPIHPGAAMDGQLVRETQGMTLRDAMALSVRMPDEYSVRWAEVLIGEQQPNSVEPVAVHIDWWMRVEAAYRYRMADAMLKARLTAAQQAQPKRRPYDTGGSLSEYGVFPECDAQQPADDEVVFIDGVGAARSSIKSCRDGVQWIRVGDRVYWPLSDSDAKRLHSACCGNGSFDGPSAPVGMEAIREAFDEISGLCRHLRQGGPAPEDLQDLSDALDEAVGIAANMLHALPQQPAAVDEAVVEAVARAICVACEENPDHEGDARGNDFRWQDYRDAALAAISALATHQQGGAQ